MEVSLDLASLIGLVYILFLLALFKIKNYFSFWGVTADLFSKKILIMKNSQLKISGLYCILFLPVFVFLALFKVNAPFVDSISLVGWLGGILGIILFFIFIGLFIFCLIGSAIKLRDLDKIDKIIFTVLMIVALSIPIRYLLANNMI